MVVSEVFRGFDLLWEQDPCYVVSKPGGLLTQAPPGIDSLEIRFKQFLRTRSRRTGKIYLGVPHRIDRPASGALVLARHAKAARRLCEQFEDRTVEKVYWALVEGCVEPDHGTWQDTIRKVPDQARAELVVSQHPDGRSAILHYRVRARLASVCCLEIHLETGRTHQIRVQAAARGHPILGDDQYGARIAFGPQTEDPRRRWIALHARTLGFHHPRSRQRIRVTAPLPEPWRLWSKLAADPRPNWVDFGGNLGSNEACPE